MSVKNLQRSEHTIPEGEFMSSAQLEFFRLRLQDERRALLESAQSTLEQMQAIVAAADANDRATTEEELSLEFRIRDRERKLLKKIEGALSALRRARTAGAWRRASLSAFPVCSPGRPLPFA